MSEQELIEENKKLKERVAYLENIISRGNSGNCEAYNNIRGMIINKVQKEVDLSKYEEWQRKHKRQQFERRVMRDLLWEIRVRRISELRPEHIKPAEEFIEKYKFQEDLWTKIT